MHNVLCTRLHRVSAVLYPPIHSTKRDVISFVTEAPLRIFTMQQSAGHNYALYNILHISRYTLVLLCGPPP